MAFALLGATLPASAATMRSKVARDLQQVIDAAQTPKLSWAKDVDGRRYVKVLVISSGTDAELRATTCCSRARAC